METTVRYHTGEHAKELHNARDPKVVAKEEHIDPNGIHEVWSKDRFLVDAYEEIFRGALDEYNRKQRESGHGHEDRQMTMEQFMTSVLDDTRGRKRMKKNKQGERVEDPTSKKGKKLSYETVVSVGNCETDADDIGWYEGDDGQPHEWHEQAVPEEVNYKVCRRYFDTFEGRNPSLKIVRGDWHADEFYTNSKGVKEWSTPHLHLEYIAVGEGYKRGLSKQPALDRAMRAMGFNGETRERNGKKEHVCPLEQWRERERRYVEELTKEIYAEYAKDHPEFARERGGTVEIVHPYAGTDAEELSTSNYRLKTERDKLESEVKSRRADAEDYAALASKNKAKAKRYEDEMLEARKKMDEREAVLNAREIDLNARICNFNDNLVQEYVKVKNRLKTALSDFENDRKKALDALSHDGEIQKRDEFMAGIRFQDGSTALERFERQEEERRLDLEQGARRSLSSGQSEVERLLRAASEMEQERDGGEDSLDY